MKIKLRFHCEAIKELPMLIKILPDRPRLLHLTLAISACISLPTAVSALPPVNNNPHNVSGDLSLNPSVALSFIDAEQLLQQTAYVLQASRANITAAQNEEEATAQLGLPIVSLDVSAIRYRTEVDIPLSELKNTSEIVANQAFQQSINNLPVPLPDSVSGLLSNRFNGAVSGIVNQIPDSTNVVIKDKLFRPTISALLPLYTGGLIDAAQSIAHIRTQKAQIGYDQVKDQQTLKLVEAYFGQQLAVYLKKIAQQNLQGLQQHLYNATQLERQGMISKSQRLQVEVAMQAAQRQYDEAESNEQSSQIYLKQLLRQNDLSNLTTPLFIVNAPLQPLNFYLKQLNTSPQIAQLEKDQQIASQSTQVAKAAMLPIAYAFGQQTLNKNEWLVGVGARYDLLASTDRKKQLNAANARVEAAQALQLQAQQDLQQLVVRSYNQAETAKKAFLSLQTNIVSA